MKHELIFHLVSKRKWHERQNNGYYRTAEDHSEKDREDLIIKCATSDRVEEIANSKFKGRKNIYLLVINTNRVESKVDFDDTNEQLGPIIKGPLNLDAIMDKIILEPGENGEFRIEISTN